MMLKAVYIVCVAIQQIAFICGGAWLTYSGGSGWWLAGGIMMALLTADGFTRRVDSWGVLGRAGRE